MKILIINGPNLNMLGRRDEAFYGTESFDKILEKLKADFEDMEIDYFQSNVEGDIVTRIQELYDEDYHGLIINAGAYSHYSLAIHDALLIPQIPKIEVHLSNIYLREEFRRTSVLTRACDGIIAGFGKESYRLAMDYFRNNQRSRIGFGRK
ncbi:MAG TPA: type II 3-dehydroquinate dehydratase [Bacteroidetes bacterium]|nr:type II 3-dehydroquinate dehydratase [Bacteroidota bacterium]